VYTPPTPKKKKKVERTRFRETARTYRQKSPQTASTAASTVATKKDVSATVQKPGKKEKIRFGQAPTKTLPSAPSSATEDAGAVPASNTAAAAEPANPLDVTRPTQKTRFSDRAKEEKKSKSKGPQLDPDAPPPPDAAEVADRQQQAAPLGLNGASSSKKKKTTTTTGDKTRLSDKNKKPDTAAPPDSNTTPASQTPAQAQPTAPNPQR
jgi:peptidyl-prolyl cis-trans isomerase SurA